MRTSRQELYERAYFGFERFIYCHGHTASMRKKVRGVKFEKQFYKDFREKVLPYWRKFGERPEICWYKRDWIIHGYIDPRFITKPLYYRRIIPYFNQNPFIKTLNDKNLHGLLFPSVKRPQTVFRRIDGSFCEDDFTPISREEVYARLGQGEPFIIKPTRFSSGGNDIEFYDRALSRQEADRLLDRYSRTDYIVQRLVHQHPVLADFNSSSVNTIRLFTLVWHDKTYLLSSILRIGHSGSRVDNVSQGGYQVTILPDGHLDKKALTMANHGRDVYFVEQTQDGIRFDTHPPIPAWEQVCQTALRLAGGLPHLRLIGWDFTVDEAGDVVLIEFNSQPDTSQGTCGPLFGDMSDEILAEIFAKKK